MHRDLYKGRPTKHTVRHNRVAVSAHGPPVVILSKNGKAPRNAMKAPRYNRKTKATQTALLHAIWRVN